MGPLTPPVHGAAIVTEKVIEILSTCGRPVVINISPGLNDPSVKLRGLATKFGRTVRGWLSLPWLRLRGRRVLYMTLDSGHGLLLNIVTIALATALTYRVVIHHHGANYIIQRKRIVALICHILRADSYHIFNCQNMLSRFKVIYPDRSLVLHVSNSAFLPATEIQAAPRTNTVFTLGHMSNLCVEKGLKEVLETVAELRKAGIEARLVLAGPTVTASDRAIIDAARQNLGAALDYRGPVHGEAKERFFSDIDVFLFPSRYALETEPLVVVESLTRAVPVIGSAQGCVPEIVGSTGGFIIHDIQNFVEECVEYCKKFATDSVFLDRMKRAARERSRQRSAEAMEGRGRFLQALEV
jgi:glycosyltransferase involved in cell wall biosynthesis